MTFPLRSSRCCLCWDKADNNHHEPPKSQAGKHDQTITLCGSGNANGCHGLAHNNGGSVKLFPGEPWHFIVDEGGVKDLNRRRKRNGLPPVQHGFRNTVIPIEDTEGLDAFREEADERDAALAVIESEFRELDSTAGTVNHYMAVRLLTARDLFIDRYGKKEGREAFGEWRQTALGLGQAPASKLLTIARFDPDGVTRDLHASYQYAIARVCKQTGIGVETLAEEASSMPYKDFTEKHGLIKPRGHTDPELVCPECGYTSTKDSFKGAES